VHHQALVELASELELRVQPESLDRRAADLARALSQGQIDERSYESAVAVIVAVRDRPVLQAAEPVGVLDLILAMTKEDRTALAEQLVNAGVQEIGPPPVVDDMGLAADERALSQTASHLVSEGRAALRAGDYALAVQILEPVSDQPGARAFWQEATDAWVYAERERAGELYQAALGLRGPARREAMVRARDVLAGLVDTYPQTVYLEPLQRALERVERTIDALGGSR